ncbi:ParB N-terminal domain-containing protein [Leucobacter sp. W1478]|uniref:ParB N-terminal domain-containing protein n=1 Tax=Leucobacter sp. W1478 TaxID=3439065 RepID=UPI003F3732A3
MGDNMTAASAVMMYPGDYDGPLLEGVFQPMPELTGDEYEALRADVKARGIVTPVMVDQRGRVLDGHHRLKVARDLGIVCPVIVHPVTDDAEAWGLALAVNAARRQLNREQRRELIRRELMRCPGDSDRAIARRVGCSPSTVGAIRNPGRGVSKLDSEPATEGARDVDEDMRALLLKHYDGMNLTPELAASDEEAELLEAVMIQEADHTLWLRVALAAGAEPMRVGVAVISCMALWKARGLDRRLIRRLFTPWLNATLSPNYRADLMADPMLRPFVPEGEEAREELIELSLNYVGSVPKLPYATADSRAKLEALAITVQARDHLRKARRELISVAMDLLRHGVHPEEVVQALERRRALFAAMADNPEIQAAAGLIVDPVIRDVRDPHTIRAAAEADPPPPRLAPHDAGALLAMLAGGAL